MTEDTLEQYGRMLTNLGTSDESAFARAKMQTPSLLSDMEAFKVRLWLFKFKFLLFLLARILLGG